MQHVKKNRKEVPIIANIKQFRLADWVEEGSEVITKLREFIKTGNQTLFDQLTLVGAILGYTEGHNLITTAGRSVLAARLAGDTANTGEINYGALGTAVSPVPVNGSTQLGTEAYRKLQSSQSFDGNVAYVDFFFAATDCNGTYTEFGNFIDGVAGANTGKLFSYIATGNWVKSSSESLFVSCQYTIT